MIRLGFFNRTELRIFKQYDGDIMCNMKTDPKSKIITEQKLERFKGPELVITPKKEFLKWYKHSKTIFRGTNIKIPQKEFNRVRCPSCKSELDHLMINDTPGKWYICDKCNLTFSQTQYIIYVLMILRIIENELSPLKVG